MDVKTKTSPRRKRGQTGRRLQTGLYRDGEKTLFVAAAQMFDVRKLFTDARKNGDATSVRAVLRNSNPGLRKAVDSWLQLYRNVPWFRAWLLEGANLPTDVYAPTAGEVGRMLVVCHYAAHMRAIGHPKGHVGYTNYFGDGPKHGFPAEQIAEWIEWLYGGRSPNGWLVVSELAVQTRNQLTRGKICAEAQLPIATFTRWKTNEDERHALAAAIARRVVGGREPREDIAWDLRFGSGLAARLAAVDNQGQREFIRDSADRSKSAMLKFAAEATENRAMDRAKRDRSLSGSLAELRKEAERIGRLDALNSYIKEFVNRIEHPPAKQPTKGKWSRCGAVAPGLFVPRRWIRSFRIHARSLWHANQIGAIKRDTLPGTRCFELWFLDWALPLEHRGSQWVTAYRKAAGLLRPSGRSPYRNEEGADAASHLIAAAVPVKVQAPAVSVQSMGLNTALDGESLAPLAVDEADRLALALAKCKTERQRKVVNAVASLTVGRPTYAPQAKEIAKLCPGENYKSSKFKNAISRCENYKSSKFKNAISRCVSLGALLSKNPGYRLA